MPYIDESNREKLDSCIGEVILCLKATVLEKPFSDKNGLSNEDILKMAHSARISSKNLDGW